jgi:putative amide transporter protein
MFLGLSLLYVGVVLILNGIWLSGRIADREIVLINLCVAAISTLVALHAAATATGIPGVRTTAMVLLFAITYLWVAYNRLTACDGRGLGWFSLIVALTVSPVALITLIGAGDMMAFWIGLCWTSWAVLWLMYFLLLALQCPIQRGTALFTLICGIFTGWLPGMVLLFDLA